MGPSEDQKLIDAAAACFPEFFGLRGFPGGFFCISKRESYVSVGRDNVKRLMLVVMAYRRVLPTRTHDFASPYDGDGNWMGFSKGTASEIEREVIPAPKRR